MCNGADSLAHAPADTRCFSWQEFGHGPKVLSWAASPVVPPPAFCDAIVGGLVPDDSWMRSGTYSWPAWLCCALQFCSEV